MAYSCACAILPDTLGKICTERSPWLCGICDEPVAVCEFFLVPDVHYSEINRLIMHDGLSRCESVFLYHDAIGTMRRQWSEGETSFLWTTYIKDPVQQSRDLIPFWMQFFSHRSPVDLIDRILCIRMLIQVGLCRSTILTFLCGNKRVVKRIWRAELRRLIMSTPNGES